MKNLFSIFWALFMFQHYIVDGGAGGGDDDPAGGGDVGDVDIDDDNLDGDDPAGTGGDDKDGKNSTGESPSTEDVLKLQQQIKELQEDKNTRESNEAQTSILSGLKTKYPEFEASKVEEYLKELHKTDPAKAESLNNGVGWELVHLQEFAPAKIDNDDIGFGRNDGGTNRTEEIHEKLANGGSASQQDKEALLSKFF
ncbi:MAG: hypothetical protein KAQ94_06065 [Arcobacteraceae bacterium]|nr:hypothetical protein [Arcobacteraceae bacterium]